MEHRSGLQPMCGRVSNTLEQRLPPRFLFNTGNTISGMFPERVVLREGMFMSRLSDELSPSDRVGPVSVLDRVFAVLDVVRASAGPITVASLAGETRIPKSTAARLVSDLITQRYQAHSPGGGGGLGARATIPRRIASAAAPVVRDLARRTGERIGVWVQQGTDMVSLTSVPGRLPMLPTRAGMRSPALTTASGKAYLAFCEDQNVVDLVSAPLPDREVERFYDELTSVRADTIATDRGNSYAGVVAVASPVIDRSGEVVGAISAAGPAESIQTSQVSPLVLAASISLTRRLAAA